mmetsp:Transcript_141461/g.257099  ORF Transcript_141461/g.257099 Transcript_141461/m.257099 type:complete len:113 (-) Transcript_141461:76-414(-)
MPDFEFYFDKDAVKSSAGTGKPPAGFSAHKSSSDFVEDAASLAAQNGRTVADYAGAGGAGAGAGVGAGVGGGIGGAEQTGPALPFRVKRVQVWPTAPRRDTCFTKQTMSIAD